MQTDDILDLPLVSLSDYEANFSHFSQGFGESFEKTGFGVLSNHGIDAHVIEKAYLLSKEFFDLPEITKHAYHLKNKGARGYTPFGIETAKDHIHFDLKEFWHVGRSLADDHDYRHFMADNVWPAEVSDFKETFETLFLAFEDLGQKILEGIAVYLDQPRDFFAQPMKDGNSVLRLLHYPPIKHDGPSIRAGAHCDINVITLLLGAEEPGLQVQDVNGNWLSLTPPENCLVVNCGDMLARLTNDRLPSTRHQVINPISERRDKARFSLPFFHHFAPTYLIETLPNCVTAARPNRYPSPITAEDFLRQRLSDIKLG